MKSIVSYIFPVMLSLAGLLFLAFGLVGIRRPLTILVTGSYAQGIVLKNTSQQVAPLSTNRVIQFTTNTGDNRFHASVPSDYNTGQHVDIWYVPDVQYESIILYDRSTWGGPVFFIAFGLIALVSGLRVMRAKTT